MMISCVICCESEKRPLSSSPREFQSIEGLRHHLIDSHSKYVAGALLAPKLSDKKHAWLYNSVIDYTGLQTTEDSMQSNASIQAAEMPSKFMMTDISDKLGFSLLLNTLLSTSAVANSTNNLDLNRSFTEDSENMEEIDEDNQNSVEDRSPTLHELFNFNPLPGIISNAVEKLGNISDNGHLVAQNESNTSHVEDSKAIRKTLCQVCNVKVCVTARQRHVYMVHLKQPDLFQCLQCNYMNSSSLWELRRHCTTQHGSDKSAISNEQKHSKIIQIWNQKCFPDWKPKQSATSVDSVKLETNVCDEPLIKTETSQNNELQTQELQACLTTFIQTMQNISEWDKLGDTLQNDGNVDESSNDSSDKTLDNGTGYEPEQINCGESTPSTSMDKKLLPNDRICHLCWEESRYPGRHIAQKHLGKPLYECPVCLAFGSYEGCTVVKHINKAHPKEATNAPHVTPISNLEKFADEIRELQTKCFPNRPMKLVRTQVLARPRERHHCQLCSTLVAQSDRQRHVYHRHLRKERVFECPLCEFSSNYDVHRVKWHLKWIHKDMEGEGLEPISHEEEYREEIDRLNEQCFPGWQHRKRPFWWLEPAGGNASTSEPQSNGEPDGKADETLRKKQKTSKCEVSSQPSSSVSVPHESNISHIEKKPVDAAKPKEWTCNLCGKEFKPSSNFLRHVAKEHLSIPLYQCPICGGHGGPDAYDIRTHIARVHGKQDLEPVSNIETYAEQIEKVYQQCFPGRKLKCLADKVKPRSEVQTPEPKPSTTIEDANSCRVQCKECGMEMKTEDRQIHVYRHHLKEPRLYECPICDFSHHACSSDVRAHIKFVHRDQPDLLPKANLLRFSKEINEWNDRCFPGWINRRLPAASLEDFNRCRVCEVEVRQTSRHIAEVHLNIPLHQCPLCEYGAAESRLVKRHMKNNHKKKDIKNLEPIANVVKRRSDFSALHNQCFPGRPKRLTNITISDEGRRTKCKKCGMTISKKRRLQHLLEKHLRKPIYRCRHCSYNSSYDKSLVEAHISEKHEKAKTTEISVEINKHITALKELAKSCFNDPNMKFV
ncbi:formin-homology and zinc finger domains protein 1 [Ditylenchus destructor]|uniref:Formin-homology and zinc finger domains protein 1 n=1 Tax=Ditylenchus destructor TaxID=166010 RepID=A0AAD4NN37_9BILA|nr:formin-homology and zinc finger domains protein 1 [Ditylenchus destructor]